MATRFDVSERTIYRDLKALASQGADVVGAAGFGFVLRPGFFLPPLMLTQDEANAVVLGLRFVVRRGDGALGRAARSAMAKVSEVLPHVAAASARENGLVVAPSGSGEDVRIAQVRASLDAGCKVRIRYRDGAGAESERVVWPVALGFFDGVEVLAAWCETRSGFRHFRLDRIRSLDHLPDPLPTARHALFARWREGERGVET